MYIQDFDIKGFKWIDIKSRIREIQGEAPNQVQVVIGANGGGKSTLLTQLTPLPASKNDYYRGGYKKLHILHQGNEYEISSNFETKAGKHSFIKNGAELNISGLSSLQIDLCREHLGYTPQLDDLTHCRFRMSQMSVAERKNLILSLSPSTPAFVVELHKLAKSSLRSCYASIKMLETRKAEIQQKLQTPEQLAGLKTKLESVDKVQLQVSNSIFHLEEKLKEFETELAKHGEMSEVPEENIKRYRKRVQQLKYELQKGNYPPTEKSVLEQELWKLQEKHAQCVEAYNKLEGELAEYDRAILEQQDTGKKECQDLIAERSFQLKSIKEWADYPTIDPDKLDDHVQAIQNVERIVENFPAEIKQHEQLLGKWGLIDCLDSKLQMVSTMRERWGQEKRNIENKIRDSQEELKKIPNAGELPSCGAQAENCEYYQHFSNQRKRLEAAIMSLKKARDVAEEKTKRFAAATKRQVDMHCSLWRQSEAVKGISYNLAGTVWATSIDDVISHWKSRPSDWIAKMKKDILAQPHKAEIERLTKEILEAQATLRSLDKANASAIKVMRQLFDTKLTQLEEARQSVLVITKELDRTKEHLTLLTRLDKLTLMGHKLEDELSVYQEYITLVECRNLLRDVVLKDYRAQKTELDNEIHALSTVLKEQESLQARYNEEIVDLLEQQRKNEQLWHYLEMGLSPEHGMPRYQLTMFLNAILENVNFILAQIWTTPFKVSLIEVHTEDQDADEVSFDFKATLNDKQFASLNKLSKSEQAVVNFAFYIALIYATGNTDYPVFFDECDDGFDAEHKRTFASWLKMYMDSSYSPQMWLICHNVETYGSLLYKDVICLNKDNIYVPPEANRHVKIEKD